MKTSIENLSEAISKELTIYSESVTEGIKKEAKNSMSLLVKRTKETAPVGNRERHYKDNISSKKTSENARSILYTWFVKGSDYRLSHLLENGHAKRNGGRTKGTHFIKNASDSILEQYEKAIEEVIRNG